MTKYEKIVNDKVRCEDALKFLNYLRKSQCTRSDGSTLIGGSTMGDADQPHNKRGCKEALDLMETISTECLRGLRK